MIILIMVNKNSISISSLLSYSIMTSSLKKIGNDASVWGQSTHPEVWGWWESILVSKCPLRPFLSVLSSALKSARTSDHFNVSPGRLLVFILNIPIVFINWYYGSMCMALLPLLPVCWQYTQMDRNHPFSAWLSKPSAPLRRPGHVPGPLQCEFIVFGHHHPAGHQCPVSGFYDHYNLL